MAAKVKAARKKTIGDYELLEKIADGGMGAVFRARHQVTETLVALKVVSAAVAADPVLSRRVEQEFQAARSLAHPHIVRGLDFGMDGQAPYLVMELVEGESLGDRIEREGRLPEAQAVAILVQVAEAMHFLHQHNTIHRDIKPDNILLTPNGLAKVADFGLVKFMDAETVLTQDSSALGTPNFMAPEQFEDSSRVDLRADVYSLGATLYMAVTGQLPFQTRNPRQFLQILQKKWHNDLALPRQLVPGLSEEVDFAIRRAVRADREQRFQDCQEFIAALTGRVAALEQPRGRQARRSRSERRAAVRHTSDIQGSCQPTARTSEKSWHASVQDISVHGLRLSVPRRFEPGTLLTVDVASTDQRTQRTLLVRVKRVVRESPKAWEIGCVLLTPLGTSELRDLL